MRTTLELANESYSKAIDIVRSNNGVHASVVLAHPVLVKDVRKELSVSRIRDRKVTINPNSALENDPKSNISPALNITALDKASGKAALPVPEHSVLPQHLFPESTAIAEKRRLYIQNLPYGTTEEVLQDLLKDLSMCTRNIDRFIL